MKINKADIIKSIVVIVGIMSFLYIDSLVVGY